MSTRRLILMRHAKSSWDGSFADHDRPLNDRGERDAPRIAEALRRLGRAPDWVLHSSACRTTQTWELMQPIFGQAIPALSLESLYLAGLQEVQEAVQAAPPEAETILVIGHNPGWEMAASKLARESIHLTTANAAVFGAAEGYQWQDGLLGREVWQLERLLRPKELDGLPST